MTRLAAALPLLLAGCAAPPTEPLAAPAFPQHRPTAEERILLTAGVGGVLVQRGRCLGFGDRDRFVAIVWPETARLSFDRRGLLVHDLESGAEIRLGDRIDGGGGGAGEGAAERIAASLTEPVPPECADWIVTLNPGFRRR